MDRINLTIALMWIFLIITLILSIFYNLNLFFFIILFSIIILLTIFLIFEYQPDSNQNESVKNNERIEVKK